LAIVLDLFGKYLDKPWWQLLPSKRTLCKPITGHINESHLQPLPPVRRHVSSGNIFNERVLGLKQAFADVMSADAVTACLSGIQKY